MKLALPSPPLCNVVQLFELLVRNIKKTQLFVEGGGVGGCELFCSQKLPISGQCLYNFVASSSVIKSKMAATTM